MEKKKKRLILLDSHAIIHRAYHALPDFFSSKNEPTGALFGISNMLMKIISDLKPDYIIACYDMPEKTFRHEVYEDYKKGRTKADDNLIIQIIKSKEIFEAFNIPIYESPGFEADDLLGTIVSKLNNEIENNEIEIIIASGDMDTMQLVNKDKVKVYTLKKGINDTILYDEEKVFERFNFAPSLLPDYKGLRGDPSDNIIGIKGIGEKTATNLIIKFGTIENIYEELEKNENLFKEIGLSDRIISLLKDNKEEAFFSKTLATINKNAKINFILPEKTFWQEASLEKIEKVFIEFEFRSLFSRLKNFFKDNSSFKEEDKKYLINEEELQEVSIALWVLDSNISNPSLEDILHYAKTKDFEIAKKYIFEKLEKDENLKNVFYEIEKPIIKIVKKMEDNGILIDKEYFKKLSISYNEELNKIKENIYKTAGEEFNINSPKQLSEILFNKLGIKNKKKRGVSGNLSTKISVLEELEDDYVIIKEIIKHRELQKLLSTYIEVIPEKVGEGGRLHARFLQNNTTTGRFSSQEPNLQNLPIRTELGKKIRNGFIAEKGYKICSFDYSQIELRVATILSKDKKMIEIFKSGKDIHTGVASYVFGVDMDKVDGEMRRKAKVINFGIIYGMGVNSLKKNLNSTKEEAEKFYNNYFRQFSDLFNYLEKVKEDVSKNYYTETLFGRKRYFPNINSKIPFIKNMALRTAINAPIQGTATADIIKLAIRFVEEDLKRENLEKDVKLILQIHDELVYEIKEDKVSKAKEIIKKAMESVLERSYLKYQSEIPIIVSSDEGFSLGDIK